MKRKTTENMTFGAAVMIILVALTLSAGWITNVIWTFRQNEITGIVLGALGALIAPIGSLHGIWLWF